MIPAKRASSPPPSDRPTKMSNTTTTTQENGVDKLAPTSSLLIKRLSDKAKLPTRGSALAAGYDLYRYDASQKALGGIWIVYVLCISAESKVVPANGKALIDTQISIAVPVGTYGRVAPRSGLGMFVNLI